MIFLVPIPSGDPQNEAMTSPLVSGSVFVVEKLPFSVSLASLSASTVVTASVACGFV